MQRFDFDLVVIGAGSGGVRASRFASLNYKKQVALIENRRIGGTCVMRGCVPKKLLVYGAHFAHDLQDAVGYGWSINQTNHNWAKLIEEKNIELGRLESVYHKILSDAGVKELEGTGKLLDQHTVGMGSSSITAEHILIATGGTPSIPNISGISAAITSDEALDLKKLPKKIVSIGGGYIAVEFAGIFNNFGAEVHIVIRGDKVLRGFDNTIREALSNAMKQQNIHIHSNQSVQIVEKIEGMSEMRLTDGKLIDANILMCATGREPNTHNMGLSENGVELDDKGAVKVDKYSKTTVDNIFAIGDVTNRVALTPVALKEAMAMVETVYGEKRVSVSYDNIPSAVFSVPPIGTVGLTEEEAKERYNIEIFHTSFQPLKNSLSKRLEPSVAKLIVDTETGRVLGAHMLGTDAPEIIQGIAIAIKAGATKEQFDATLGIHPTSAEEFVTMRSPDPQ